MPSPPSTRPSDAAGRRSSAFVRERHAPIDPCSRTIAVQTGKQVYRMPLNSELREVIGTLQSEVEFEAVVSELGAAGIDRARISFLAQEDIAASCAGAVGCN